MHLPAFSHWVLRDAKDALSFFSVSETRGLSHQDALSRQATYGKNVFSARPPTGLDIFFRQFSSPFVYLLVAAAFLTLFLRQYLDSGMIFGFILLNTFLGFYQEFHSERALRLLKSYVNPRARVLREGKETVIDASSLVGGDVVIVETGDVIPADLRLISCERLLIDESLLTGESLPVTKTSAPLLRSTAQIHEATNVLFCATSVVSGKGTGVVIATGKDTQVGMITRLTVETRRVSTFEKSVASFSRFILQLILVTLILVFSVNAALKGNGRTLVELAVFSIALAVSVIPEALPAVTTLSLSRGALRLARKKVVAKRLSAIEDLGSIDILCTDKTGTLTENDLTVSAVFPSQTDDPVFWAAACMSDATCEKEPNNAFDRALWRALSAEQRARILGFSRTHDVPFDPSRRRNTVCLTVDGDQVLVCRGAVETLLPLSRITSPDRLLEWARAQGQNGRRVIAVSKKTLPHRHVQDVLREEYSMTCVGLISFTDPLKPTASAAIAHAKSLGITVKIFTGDSAEVAGSVGYQTGLIDRPEDVVTGDVFDKTPQSEQQDLALHTAVFARVSPKQKYAIVSLLEKTHEVGFLGEGINDAPALKVANVAIVVDDASDIARESADIILLQRSLHVIIEGIAEGRTVYANTMKYIRATISSNFGNFYAVAIASLLVDFLPMLPVQILLLNLLSDFPMAAIATDRVETRELQKPRSYRISDIALLATLLGGVSTVADFVLFALFFRLPPAVLQTNWFIGSTLTELVFLFSIRTRRLYFTAPFPSFPLVFLSLVAAMTTVILPFTAIGQETFRFVAPEMSHVFLISLVILVYFVASECVKLLSYRFSEA